MLIAVAAVAVIIGIVWLLADGEREEPPAALLPRGGGAEPGSAVETAAEQDAGALAAETEPLSRVPPSPALPTQLWRGFTITGRVVADDTSEPVAGAEIAAYELRRAAPGEKTHAGSDADGDSAVTGAEGAFAVTGLAAGEYRIWARHPDFAEAFAEGHAGDRGIGIRLRGGPRIFGCVLDAGGRPAAGVEVAYHFLAHVRETRRIETGSDGTYATPPLPPGPYILSTIWTEKAPSVDIMPETQKVEVAESDVRVDFGPRPDQVVWRGTLFGSDGAPVAGAVIVPERVPGLVGAADRTAPRTAFCPMPTDDRGGFTIGPMDPGEYGIRIGLGSAGLSGFYMDRILFDRPGLIVRDVHLRGTELSGTVIDGTTGAPWRRAGEAFVWARSEDGSSFPARVDAEGRFRFRSLPPGTYMLTADGPEAALARLDEVVLSEGGVIDDLQIVLRACGVVVIRAVGLGAIAGQSLAVRFVSGEDGREAVISSSGRGRSAEVDNEGGCAVTAKLEPGVWRGVLQHDAIGTAERTFTVVFGEATRVEVHRSEFRK